MIPDFSKNTVDTIAKRAGYICSNPDCRVKTVGPNSGANKSTTIGEAAHIFGARSKSKRFKVEMTDSARAEITNSIWLCRNCHKLIDSDEHLFTSELLFKWREIHETFVLSELGNKTAQIKNEQIQTTLNQFSEYPPIIKRIVVDQPDGWEYRLTAELLRFLSEPGFRKIKDLQNNLYLKPQKHIDEEEAFEWVSLRLTEATNLIEPIVNLINKMNQSWGEPGVAGDINEIHHVCLLIRDYIEQIVKYEENIRFTNLPEEYEKLQLLLKNNVGQQILKIENIPNRLDEILSTLSEDQPTAKNNETEVIRETLVFELPENWERDFEKELNKVGNKEIQKRSNYTEPTTNNGCTTFFIILAIILVLMMVL